MTTKATSKKTLALTALILWWSFAVPVRAQTSAPCARMGDFTGFFTEELQELQSRLKALGLNPGPTDGLVGPQTRSGINAFCALTHTARTMEGDEGGMYLHARH